MIAALLFFSAASGILAKDIPNETAWGFLALTLGILLGGWRPQVTKAA